MTGDEAERRRAAEYVRQLAAEQRKRHEAHEAKIAPTRPIVKGRKLSTIEILQHLAVAKRIREAFYPNEPDVRISADLIDAIGIAVGGVRSWRAAVKGNRDKAAELERAVRPKARELLAKNPSVRAAAAELQKAFGGRKGTSTRNLRRILTKIKSELAKTQKWPNASSYDC